MRLLPLVSATLLALCGSSALAATKQTPLAERTEQTGLPLTQAQAAMELPHLALSIAVDPRKKTITGDAVYRVRAKAALDQVQFDLDPRFRIARIAVDGQPISKDRWRNDGGLLTITLPAPLAIGGEAAVQIAYSGAPYVAANAPWEGGFVWTKTPQGQPWIASAVQGEGCDMFWPCIDNPLSKITLLDLAITVPSPLVAAGNGKLIGQDTRGGQTTWRWQAKYPNNYGVTIQVGPYALTERDYASRFGNTVPLKFWHLPGNEAEAERLLGEMAYFLDFFESAVGPYPFANEKAGIAETPHLGMEHQTINAYGNRFKRSPEGYDWLLHHEFAHEWFANQETNRLDEEMWLHEGFGTYMQPLYLRWKDGDLAYHAALWDSRKKIVSKVALVPTEGEPKPDYNDQQLGWGGDIYYKGAWILHTLREQIGDEAFSASLRQFVYGRNDPQPGNFTPILRTSDDYQAIVEQITGKEWGWFFDVYLRQAALPKLEASRDGATLRLRWVTESGAPFPLPVEVRVDGRDVTVPMTGGTGEVALDNPAAHYVLDPGGKLLRYDPAIEEWRAWTRAQAGK